MTRILLVETASPKRVRKKAEEILEGGFCTQPDLTILCQDNPQTVQYLSEIKAAKVVPLAESRHHQILKDLRRKRFHIVYVFWTGEKKYRRMKIRALRLGGQAYQVDIGDGHCFRLSRGTFIHFLGIRWLYPLPSDHSLFASRPHLATGSDQAGVAASQPNQPAGPARAGAACQPAASAIADPAVVQPEPTPATEAAASAEPWSGEKILVVQSAEPIHVLGVLDHMQKANLFRDPRYTLFCRNRPEVIKDLASHPLLSRILTHTETRGSWRYLRDLRRERFDTLIVLFTGDPSYWKIKYFAFLLGARRSLIFNENNDCFFFSWSTWLSFLAHRMGEKSRLGAQPRWNHQIRVLAALLVKLLLLPFRFSWLLLIWLKLRSSEWRTSG